MKTIARLAMAIAAVAIMVQLVLPAAASAEEKKLVGVITKIELAADGKSAVATLKDNKTGEEIAIFVDDDVTLEKFKDRRIIDGDEIRCKYEVKDGKNHSTYFRKTAGC